MNYFFFNSFLINSIQWHFILLGELYFGTIGPKLCGDTPAQGFYKLTPDGQVTKMLDGLLTSNGVTYVPKTKKLYHMDGCKQCLMEYTLRNGKLCKKKHTIEKLI